MLVFGNSFTIKLSYKAQYSQIPSTTLINTFVISTKIFWLPNNVNRSLFLARYSQIFYIEVYCTFQRFIRIPVVDLPARRYSHKVWGLSPLLQPQYLRLSQKLVFLVIYLFWIKFSVFHIMWLLQQVK